jgi:hypothetical protein
MRNIIGVDESQAVLRDDFDSILEAVSILDILSMPDRARVSHSLLNSGLPYLTILGSDG